MDETTLPAVPDAARYANALTQLAGRMSDLQRALLVAHYRAPGHAATADELATAAGAEGWPMVGREYERLGTMLRDALDYRAEGPQSYAIASFVPPGSQVNAGWRWVMHPELAAAIASLGWASDAESAATAAQSRMKGVKHRGLFGATYAECFLCCMRLPEDVDTCPRCNSKELQLNPARHHRNSRFCNGCGTWMPGNAAFCQFCGTTADYKPPLSTQYAVIPRSKAFYENLTELERRLRTCLNCKKLLPVKSFYCPYCGIDRPELRLEDRHKAIYADVFCFSSLLIVIGETIIWWSISTWKPLLLIIPIISIYTKLRPESTLSKVEIQEMEIIPRGHKLAFLFGEKWSFIWPITFLVTVWHQYTGNILLSQVFMIVTCLLITLSQFRESSPGPNTLSVKYVGQCAKCNDEGIVNYDGLCERCKNEEIQEAVGESVAEKRERKREERRQIDQDIRDRWR